MNNAAATHATISGTSTDGSNRITGRETCGNTTLAALVIICHTILGQSRPVRSYRIHDMMLMSTVGTKCTAVPCAKANRRLEVHNATHAPAPCRIRLYTNPRNTSSSETGAKTSETRSTTATGAEENVSEYRSNDASPNDATTVPAICPSIYMATAKTTKSRIQIPSGDRLAGAADLQKRDHTMTAMTQKASATTVATRPAPTMRYAT